jgi:hypothetical protein
LEEIIPESKHQPVKANPDEIMNIGKTNKLYEGQADETKKLDNKEEEIEEDTSNYDVWRNFIIAAKRTKVDTLVGEDKKVFRVVF